MEGDEEFFLHRAHIGPSPNPSPAGRGVICEVTPIGLLTRFLGSSFSHRAHRVHWAFLRTFRAHRTPPAYRVHRALLPKVAVRFCDIGWLNVSVGLCVFCSSVFSVRKRTSLRLAGEYFLSQNSQILQNLFAHCFELTERLRHTDITEAFQLRLAVTFCEIGWLNVSVKLCVFCSSVFFCEKKNAPSIWD